jgi:Ni,Fe-hydrogenase maturation factor
MKNKVYVLGNSLVDGDSLPLKIIGQLREIFPKIEFVELDPTENLLEEENLVLIDTIVGIDKVRVLTLEDLDKVELSPRNSVHDFDLGFQLKLMKKLGKVKNVKIIGVPVDYNQKMAVGEISKVLTKT